MSYPSIIAIDGTSASGKSTIGFLLAKHLGYVLFDTGIMYRAVTWAALERDISPHDEDAVTRLAEQVHIDVEAPKVHDGRQYTVLVDGKDVTWDIRKANVEGDVSVISAYPGVREALTAQQRRIGRQGGVVMVGRDIGTVVFPEADFKLFLDATPEERARRRYLELVERGQTPSFEHVLEGILARDAYDSQREVAPLRQADDAYYLDTTDLSVEDVLAKVVELVSTAQARQEVCGC